MKQQFEILKASRNNIIKILDNCSEEELSKVSSKYNNNIIWNAAHLVATTQLLCYKLSNNTMNVSNEFIDQYRKGTAATAEGNISLEELKKLLISTAEQLEEDYNQGLFKEFTSYPTSFGITLYSIEDAISFNNVHDGIHFGYLLAQKRGL